MRVFVMGGTGLVGSRLMKRLMDRGDVPVLLTRRYGTARQMFGPEVQLVEGDPMQPGDWMSGIDDCDAVINLTGENVFNRRWGTAFKTLLYDSRINSTRHAVEALKRKPKRVDGTPKILVNASAIGIHGPHGDEELTEDSPPGSDFLAQLCVDWEKEARKAEEAGVRVAMIRVGIVLDREGGALRQMMGPFKWFIGGPVASGRQYMSWIHQEDLCGLFLLALDKREAAGPVNGTAPNPVTNKVFSQALGRALNRPSFMWVPGFMLRLRFGEVANVISQGQRVLPKRALGLGYTFKFPTIDEALADILK
jgi:uncharacterized protein (TIGR01777 family)